MKQFTINLLAFVIFTTCLVIAYGMLQTGNQPATSAIPVNKKPIPQAERDPNRLWCNEHALYEDECVICHPEIALNKQDGKPSTGTARDPNRLWCNEHSLYEDECLLCHPELAKKKEITPVSAEGLSQIFIDLFCNEHGVPEKLCGICQPQLAEQLKLGEGLKIRLASSSSIQKANVRTGRPNTGSVEKNQTYLSEVIFNQNRVAHISSLAGGVIQKVLVDIGAHVEEGQVLVEIASNEIAKAKNDYLQALDQENLKRTGFLREKELLEKKITAKQDYQQAEADYHMAQSSTKSTYQQLMNYGLSSSEIESLRNQRLNTSLIRVRAPFSGTLIEKHAVLGEAVEPGELIFQLVDLSTMWLKISVPESQLHHLQIGTPVTAKFDSLPLEDIVGKITWISSQIDPSTRLLEARAEVVNENNRLKQGLYGRAYISNETQEENLLIPADAIQEVDGKPFVFVKEESDLYELRHIALGNRSRDIAEVTHGLHPNDEIVISNSFALKSEFLKSRFGAGCTDH